MNLIIQGKQMDLGDALRTHVTTKTEEINQKYFNHATDATIVFSQEGHGHGQVKVRISIRVGKDIMVMADSLEPDSYVAFDTAAEKVAKQLRRYKNRLRDHHRRLEQMSENQIMKARDYILADGLDSEDEVQKSDESVPQGKDPVVVAEMTTDIQTMSVSEAVMRMDLAADTALLFRNASHNGLNMIYRRSDGNIGWVDPVGNDDELNQAQSA